MLANCPKGAEEQWPQEAICEVLEKTRSRIMEEGFRNQIINNRGVVCKSPFEGGQQEMDLAGKYTNLFVSLNEKYPRTAIIFKNLSELYEQDAKREDDNAKKRELGY